MVILLGRKLEAVNIGSKNCFGFVEQEILGWITKDVV